MNPASRPSRAKISARTPAPGRAAKTVKEVRDRIVAPLVRHVGVGVDEPGQERRVVQIDDRRARGKGMPEPTALICPRPP